MMGLTLDRPHAEVESGPVTGSAELAAASLDAAVTAYLAYALRCPALDEGEDEGNADGLEVAQPVAWRAFVEKLAVYRAELARLPPAAAASLAGSAADAHAVLLQGVRRGLPDAAFFNSAARRTLAGLAAAPGEADPKQTPLGMDAGEFLRVLPLRPAIWMAAIATTAGERDLASRLAVDAPGTTAAGLALKARILLEAGALDAARSLTALLLGRHAVTPQARETGIRLALAESHAQLEDRRPERAVDTLRTALACGLSAPELELELGVALRAAGEPLAALVRFAAASALPRALVELGRTRLKLDDPDAARALFEGALGTLADLPGRIGLAEVDRWEGAPDRGLDRLLDIRETEESRRARAACLIDLGDARRAVSILAPCDPHDLESLLLRVRANRLMGDLGAAYDAFLDIPEAAAQAVGFRVEAALLGLAAGDSRGSEDVALTWVTPSLAPQAFYHETTLSPDSASEGRRLLERLAQALRDAGTPIRLLAGAGGRMVLALSGDRLVGPPLSAPSANEHATAPLHSPPPLADPY